MITVLEKDVKIEQGKDLIGIYELTDTESGKPKPRAFCKTCGTPLWTQPASYKERGEMTIRTALFDSDTCVSLTTIF